MAKEQKMTQMDALKTLVASVNGLEDRTEAEVQAIDIVSKMIETRENRKRAPQKNPAAEAFRAVLVNVLSGAEPMTNAEITAAIQELKDSGEDIDLGTKDGAVITKVSPQKVANNIRVLEKDGVVVRVRGEKASDKDTFALA